MAAERDPADDLDLVLQASAPRSRSDIVGIRELLRGRAATSPGRSGRRQFAVLVWTSAVVAAGAAGAWIVHEALFPDTGTATAVSVWQNPDPPALPDRELSTALVPWPRPSRPSCAGCRVRLVQLRTPDG